jgi:hypothetical protein
MRTQRSKAMKSRWIERREEYLQNAIRNLPKDNKGKNNYITQSIEYNGVIYYGWRELKEATKVSKFLYRKYYLHGMNPELRIGKDGPPVKRKEGLK